MTGSASSKLVLALRFHEGRYHGSGDWPPSPARLFQALVAGLGLGGPLSIEELRAFQWLEGLDPPMIFAPQGDRGARVQLYVPRNDADLPGRPEHRHLPPWAAERVAEVRMAKVIEPRLFDATVPIVYVWSFESTPISRAQAEAVVGIAQHLYRVGHGIDVAWADARVETETPSLPGGTLFRPVAGQGKIALSCPRPGTTLSLEERHSASTRRLSTEHGGTVLVQAPRPAFRTVAYAEEPDRILFELRNADGDPYAWPLVRAADLARIVLQRIDSQGASSGQREMATNVQVVPLPSIGSRHADLAIRRFVIENRSADSATWRRATSFLEGADFGSGIILARGSRDDRMLDHYGFDGRASSTWRSITPVALPREPGTSRATSGSERARNEAFLAEEVVRGLRRARFLTPVEDVRIQREPFDLRGERADRFIGVSAPRTVATHVAVKFAHPVEGPILLGAMTQVGFGLLAPDRA